MPPINRPAPQLPPEKPPGQAPTATSGYGPGGVLQSQVQGVQGFAPSHLSDLGQYFQQFQPDTRLPQATVGQQYGAFRPQPSEPLLHTSGRAPGAANLQQQAPEDWVDIPAQRHLSMGGPSGTVRVKRDSQAAQQTGIGVVGY